MKILIILAHPDIRNFSGSMFSSGAALLKESGHEIKTSNLYGMRFNPVYGRKNFRTQAHPLFFIHEQEERHAAEHKGFANDVMEEQEKVEWCELMIWHFPLWWSGMPAMLKGWVDKTFSQGRLYFHNRNFEQGLMSGKFALLSVTAGASHVDYSTEGNFGPLDAYLYPIKRGILEATGFTVLPPHIVYDTNELTVAQRYTEHCRWETRLSAIQMEIASIENNDKIHTTSESA